VDVGLDKTGNDRTPLCVDDCGLAPQRVPDVPNGDDPVSKAGDPARIDFAGTYVDHLRVDDSQGRPSGMASGEEQFSVHPCLKARGMPEPG
jgi:hypothetical protein